MSPCFPLSSGMPIRKERVSEVRGWSTMEYANRVHTETTDMFVIRFRLIWWLRTNLPTLLHLEKRKGRYLFLEGSRIFPVLVSFLRQATQSLDTIRFLLSGILLASAPEVFVTLQGYGRFFVLIFVKNNANGL